MSTATAKKQKKKAASKVRFPFDRTFQRKVIQTLFQDPDFAATAPDYIKPAYFEEPHHRWLAKTIFWHERTHGSSITKTVLKREAEKAVANRIIRPEEIELYAKLIGKINKPVSDRTYIKQEVFNFCQEQELKSLVLEAVDEYLPKGRLEELKQKMLQVAQMDFEQNNGLGHFLAEKVEDRQKKREKKRLNGISTGTKLDAYMEPGGLPPKALGMVLAPSGRGKSNWLIHAATIAALDCNLPVVYYTSELDEEMVGDRFDAHLTGIPIKLLKKNGDQFKDRWNDLGLGKKLAGQICVKEYPMGTMTIAKIKQHLKNLERVAFYPKLIIVDYVDIMVPPIRYDNEYASQGESAKALKGLAMEKKIAVWTGSQTNKESYEAESLGLQNTAESMKKIHIADFVIVLNQTREERKNNRMRIAIEKSRFGATGPEITVKSEHETATFKDVAAKAT